MLALVSIGMKIPETAVFPPGIDSIESGLNSIDVAYHMNYRGGEIGVYQATTVSERQIDVLCRNPYPIISITESSKGWPGASAQWVIQRPSTMTTQRRAVSMAPTRVYATSSGNPINDIHHLALYMVDIPSRLPLRYRSSHR